MDRPAPNEYPDYFSHYVALVPDGPLLDIMGSSMETTQALLGNLTEEQATFRYAPDKWTIKELVGHLSDAERVFCYRAMAIARGDQTDLPGYDHIAYVPEQQANMHSLHDLLEEYSAIRTATRCFFKALSPEHLLRGGTANKSHMTARALGYILIGHELHHRGIIQERYLSAFS